MSFQLTTDQILRREKTVTRRLGWKNLKPGQRIQACRKCMGLKKGEKVEKLCVIEIISVSEEKLDVMLHPSATTLEYFHQEMVKEGLKFAVPSTFVAFFCVNHKGCTPSTTVTRIEFKYV